MKHKKIVFVCTGNTCRSPMAEAILKSKIKFNKVRWWKVSSCGIHAEVNNGISPNSKTALEEIGIYCDKFKPTQLTQNIIEEAHIVICMTSSQKQLLEGCGNVVCVNDLCGFDVPDPYGGNLQVYRYTRDAIEKACDVIIEKLIINGDI